ncbi:uncharacterized protein OCT59_015343 [Rhizophagus irregularis]|uniref:DUF8211 domain-containing protein n=3 Tax=Rhizophagus irregularis TaxID=588596 RepID=A0A015K527_RHIIW|nr:hypothetical protein GLOIN_2v1470151 [Rhizophagus irregularis DAOM 181602=DAOM 197198]EXX76887.1 hypothetical protein RirG_028880 [Rhizophagus irregularis DAOM 197198w]POG82179.1 hypothetical protein GLOIN_2v1470151 [Rhizophagus irregularis DAOM 181602=DAOM 197198]UZO22997.1 hypothetical protein OCT59_015343 [Rhizophagus irregularis]GBC18776.1 hypothetical protein GLOIN_2v1470151 [Rhizophagus irregularis DAOM 181602=DAOM 197198]|eukprot:XP_025189045.1 hypothetical protein GLOIN_2v1470151 [Rhizophagus irregularis DAOM 181602=DAOM 197198]
MYRKRLTNFQSYHSDSSKRSKKQKLRFQRACRSIFYNRGHKPKKKPHKRSITKEEKLYRARQHHFLFLPSLVIAKPIEHLKYYKGFMLRTEDDYKFPIPPKRSRGPVGAGAVITTIQDRLSRQHPGNKLPSTSHTHSPATHLQPILLNEEKTWHEKLGIWIPNDLFPYVTEEPIYISKRQERLKGQQYEPGCIYWFDAIRKRKNAHELAIQRQKEHEAREVSCLAHEAELSTRAKLWGTSTNRIEYREDMTKDLTKFQDHFHKKITPLIDRRSVLQNRLSQSKNVYKTNKQLLQLEHELGCFNIEYFSVIDDNGPHYRYKGHTSDDTKQLELRPHKRPPILSTNTDRHSIDIKKLRLDMTSPEDLKVFTLP